MVGNAESSESLAGSTERWFVSQVGIEMSEFECLAAFGR
jgi:hypothetical protein